MFRINSAIGGDVIRLWESMIDDALGHLQLTANGVHDAPAGNPLLLGQESVSCKIFSLSL